MAKKVVTAVTYRAKSDCLVFGSYRAAGEEFTEQPWDKVYKWDMPDFIEVVGKSESDTPDDAPEAGALG